MAGATIVFEGKAPRLRGWGLVIPGYLGSGSNPESQEHRAEWEGTDFELV